MTNYEGGDLDTTSKGGSIKVRGGRNFPRGGRQTDTNKNSNNNYKKNSSSFKKKTEKKPYFRGDEMRFSRNKWWVLPSDGSRWLEFAGLKEDIEWK